MSGVASWKAKIELDIEDLRKQLLNAENSIDQVTKEDRKIKLDLDTKTLESAIRKLDTMLDSLGKGSNNFKQFENLSAQLSSVTKDISNIGKAFSSMNDGTELVNNIKSINTSLTTLSNHFVSEVSGRMSTSIKDIKSTLSDVGDGDELTPLLKTINNIESAINKLSSSVKGIGLNMNIDFGSDTEMESKAQAKISNALQAYQRLFDHIKMSGVGGQIITDKFFDFDINQFDTSMSKLQAYRKFIENMRNEAKQVFNGQDVLKTDTDNKYWSQATSAMAQVTKTFNEMKAATDTNPLENIFGKADLTEVIAQLGSIAGKLDEISNSAKNFVNAFKGGLDVTASVQEVTDLTNRVKELEAELAKIKSTSASTPQVESNISSNVSQSTEQSLKKQQQIESQIQQQKDAFNRSNLNAIDMEIQKREEASKAFSNSLKAQMNESVAYEKQLAKINNVTKKHSEYSTDYETDSTKKGYSPTNQYLNNINVYKSKVKELQDFAKILSKQQYITPDQLKQFDELKQKCENARKVLTDMKASDKGAWAVDIEKEISKLISDMKKNTGYSEEAKQKLQEYINTLRNMGVSETTLREIHEQFLNITNAEKLAGREGKSFFDILSNSRLHQMAAQIAGMFSFYDLINAGKYGFNVVKDLDTQFTEMRKVSEESIQSLKNYQVETFDTADAVGTTAKQIQASTADYMRLGESLDEAAESAKTANILFNVSEFDNIEDATKSLVAMGQAYKDLDKLTIVDKLNEVGNNYSISTDELASALQRSAATLSLMGNTIDEAAAMVTTANATIQDADSVSAGLRTISLRLVGTEKAEEELSAMDEEVDAFVKATNSKKQQIIKDYTAVASNDYKGFDILDSNGNYKNTYEILLGIAKIYKEIQEQDKKLGTNHATAIIEELAGKNRSSIASAILQDPTQLEAVKKSSEEASGSATKELDKYLDSIEGKIAKLQNRVQEFWATAINSDSLKVGIDFLTNIVELGTSFVDIMGTLPTILGTISSLGISKLGEGSLD